MDTPEWTMQAEKKLSADSRYRVLYWQSTSRNIGAGSYRSLLDTVDAASQLGHVSGLVVARVEPPSALRPCGDVRFAHWPDSEIRHAARRVYNSVLARTPSHGLRLPHVRKFIFRKKLRYMRKLLHEFRPQIIHLSQQIERDIVLLREAVRRGIPVVQHFRGLPAQYLIQEDVRFFNEHGVRGIATSEFNRQAWIAAGLKAELIELIPPLIKPAQCDPDASAAPTDAGAPDRKTLLFVGRLVPEKAPDLVVDAFARAATDGWRLQILGHGEMESTLRRQARQLGLEARVEFIKHSDYPGTYYQQADIVVVPNFNEVFGRTTVEAMFHSKPVITSDTGGSREIVDHMHTGVRVTGRDIDAWASALTRLQSDPAMRHQLGENAAISAQKYCDRERHVNALLAVYDSAMSSPN